MVKIPKGDLPEVSLAAIEEYLEGRMEPYMEYGACSKEERAAFCKKYCKFDNVEKEERQKYETGSTEAMRLSNGEIIMSWDDRFKDGFPEDAQKEQVAFNKIYVTFDDYMKEYSGYREKDPNHGYGYWTNPNQRWDWYRVGGRWAGRLLMKPNAIGGQAAKVGYEFEMQGENPYKGGGRDFGRIGDVDWQAMNERSDKNCRKAFEDYVDWFAAGHNVQDKAYSDSIMWDASDIDTLSDKPRDGFVPCFGKTHKQLYCREPQSYEDWKKLAFHYYQFSTYSVLDGEGWKERGKMGWWGVSHSTTDQARQWRDNFYEQVIRNEDPETLVVILDCHT
jgi:hypothetical protein